MPAYLLEQKAPQEDTQEKRERLKQEIEGYTGAGAVYRRRVRKFMEKHGIWRIEELDYDWRKVFAEEIRRTVKTRYHSFYLKCFDHIKQYDMRRQVRLQVSRKNQKLSTVIPTRTGCCFCRTTRYRSWWYGWMPARRGRNGYGIFQGKRRER